jgi:O-methyltransferase domain
LSAKRQYPRPERLQILQYLNSMWLSYAIQAAAHFDFATHIGDGEKSTEGLAQLTGAKESWGMLEACMHTGRPAVSMLYNQSLYEYLAAHSDEEQIFDNAMGNLSMMGIPGIIQTVDFSRFNIVIDVGGGDGTLLLKILEQYPSLHAILFERLQVIEAARARGVGRSIQMIAGDFRQEIPPGGDAYIFKAVFHNCDDDFCVSILSLCKQVMPAHAVILVCEQVINDSTLGALTKGLDILMGLEPQGHERTEEEFRSLFEQAGFEVKVIPAYPSQWIFEASPRP